MTTPVKPRPFASAGNYPAGSDDWSGQPRVVELTDGERADGFTPDTPVPAEVLNGLFAEQSTAAEVLVHRAMREWTKERIGYDNGVGDGVEFPYVLACSLNMNDESHAVVAVGRSENATPDACCYVRSLDGTYFDFSDTAPGSSIFPDQLAGPTYLEQPTCVGPAVGGFMVGNIQNSDGYVTLVSGFGRLVDQHFIPLGSEYPTAVFYSRAVARYLVATNGRNVQYSGSFGSGWASTSALATAGFDAAAYGAPGGEFADNGPGGGVVLFCTRCTVGGVDRFRVFRSTDGAAWSVVHTGGASDAMMNVAWSEGDACFYALGSQGALYRSGDGSSWDFVKATSITSGNGASLLHGTMACAGHVLAKVMSPPAGGDHVYTGVTYSVDGGITWYFTPFGYGFGDTNSGYLFTPTPVLSLASGNGRLFAADKYRVFRSGIAAYGGPLFT